MATLTETAHYTRRGLVFGTIALIGFIVLKIALNLAGDVWRRLHPPPPPPPTVAFGKLPPLEFPEKESSSATESAIPAKLTYKLETIEGGLPKLPNVSKVYFMPIAKPSLLALKRAKEKAQKMGFVSQPKPITKTLYQWTTLAVPPTTLEMDINHGSFHFFYPYKTDQTLLTTKNLPTNQQSAQEAKNFLRNNEFLTDDLAEGTIEFDYLRLTPSGLFPAISLSEADFVRTNLFRSQLDGLKILPPNPKRSLVSFLFSGAREQGKRIIEIYYSYFPIERETSATYPLKPVTVAWQEVQTGNGYLANLGQNENGQITIRRAYLAYYDALKPQNYLQPIYVFEGDKNFFSYSPAIDPKWTE